VLAYLSRYTHRVAISNSRLIAADATSVTFKVEDYRIDGPGRSKTMTLSPGEFIRRFLLHLLPKGFHRIRHYGLLAGTAKAQMLAKARELLAVSATEPEADVATEHVLQCPCCGGRMHVIETFEPGTYPSHGPSAPAGAIRIDTS
jgi:Putative transposase